MRYCLTQKPCKNDRYTADAAGRKSVRVLEEKVSEWEPFAEIETVLRELEKECGIVTDSE